MLETAQLVLHVHVLTMPLACASILWRPAICVGVAHEFPSAMNGTILVPFPTRHARLMVLLGNQKSFRYLLCWQWLAFFIKKSQFVGNLAINLSTRFSTGFRNLPLTDQISLHYTLKTIYNTSAQDVELYP